MGLVSELMKQGVKLLLVDVQREYVRFSDEIYAREPRLGYEPINKEEATVITCEESRVFLRTLGIDGEIISTTDLADLFNELEYNTPFSIVMVDQQMETIADIYTLDDNNIVIGDDFWEKMDKELDDFFEKLMSDTSRK